MAEYSVQCGPNAKDKYGDWCGNNFRFHTISGEGIVTSCDAYDYSSYNESYVISNGITELGDKCLNHTSINKITLPETLRKIGKECFYSTKLTSITLPKSLEEIGERNFPPSLTSIMIPPLVKVFPISNLLYCNYISVDANNKNYKIYDGILYNYDMTEVLFCPRNKNSKVIIPNSVKKIGDYCFADCKELTAIIVPPSVEAIGCYAFSSISLDKLTIPNSVISIGVGCFKDTKIENTFKLSTQIVNIPNECFKGASIKCKAFFYRLKEIGNEAFYGSRSDSTISIPAVEHIGKCAFYGQYNTQTIELFSCLKEIESKAFNGIAKNTSIRIFSLAPIRVKSDVFEGMSSDTTLIVPPKTKLIFENTYPWSSFSNIQETDIAIDFEGEKTYEVSESKRIERLCSIAQSINNADRVLLQETINSLALGYTYIDTDEEYEEAIQLIDYNRKFTPAIVENLEKSICSHWSNKYKFKIMERQFIYLPLSPSHFCLTPTKGETDSPIMLPLSEIDENKLLLTEQGADRTRIVVFDEILKSIQNELSLAKDSVKVAVSWFTNFALFKQLKELAEKGIKVQIIINNDLINNGGYCLDLNKLINVGVEINLVEYPHLMHNKFCIIDDVTVINGSYNWTRFSGKNYENVMIFRNDEYVSTSFCQEFERIRENAEYKYVEQMPEAVPERPQYDRSAFKQYVTEELDAQARETSDQREKITALRNAAKINSDYLNVINPQVIETHKKEFEVIEQSENIHNQITTLLQSGKVHNDETSSMSSPSKTSTIEEVKVSSLYLVLDVSGSMEKTYSAGHVHNISRKVLAASLALSTTNEVSLWTFGDDAKFIANIGLNNIIDVEKVVCKNEGTELNTFVSKANSSIQDGALVVIFTDDDGQSINNAISGMKSRENVFWQIIVYGTTTHSLSTAINGAKNVSLQNLTDYNTKSDAEINQLIVKDYVSWKTNL